MNYELSFIISSAIPETEHDKIQKEILSYVEKASVKISKEIQVIGRRKLAYPIKKQKHGFYAFLEFEAEDKSGFKEMEIKLKHNSGILRHLLIKKDAKATPFVAEFETGTKPVVKRDVRKKADETKREEKKHEVVKEEIKLDLGDIDKKLDEILKSDPELD